MECAQVSHQIGGLVSGVLGGPDHHLTTSLTTTRGATLLTGIEGRNLAPSGYPHRSPHGLLLTSPKSCQAVCPMADRPKHPRKELETIIREAEARGWGVTKGKGYFRMLCPCGQHKKWVALTPSDPRYGTNLGKWLARQSCWEGGEG